MFSFKKTPERIVQNQIKLLEKTVTQLESYLRNFEASHALVSLPLFKIIQGNSNNIKKNHGLLQGTKYLYLDSLELNFFNDWDKLNAFRGTSLGKVAVFEIFNELKRELEIYKNFLISKLNE